MPQKAIERGLVWDYRGHPLKKVEWGLWKDLGRQHWYFLNYRPEGRNGRTVRQFAWTGGPALSLQDLKDHVRKVRSQIHARKRGVPFRVAISEARDEFITELQRRRRSTVHIVDVTRTLNALITFADTADVENISLEVIERFLAGGGRKELSARTQNKYRAHLSSFFAWALRRKYIETNPVTAIVKAQEIRRLKRFPMPEDLLSLVSASSPYDAAVWTFLVSTGLRSSSFLGLAPDSFREDGIIVQHTKEGEEWLLGYDDGCPFWTPELGILGAYIVANRKPTQGYSYIRFHFEDACAKVGRKYTLHSLRHAFCSWLAMMGEPMQDIQAWVHHSSVVTTEKWYAHLRPRGRKRAEQNRSRVLTLWLRCVKLCLPAKLLDVEL